MNKAILVLTLTLMLLITACGVQDPLPVQETDLPADTPPQVDDLADELENELGQLIPEDDEVELEEVI